MGKRPDPDELLAQVRAAEAEAARGKLTIFFGAAPGVGKTYTMLEAARIALSDEHRDVVVGIAETHGRYDTHSLLMGLELLPRRRVTHGDIQLEELDLDAALKRKPELILVDELAHTNAPGSRHAKRWQDVEELLDAGIDVLTTLNVQHLESLNDVVAQITGVVVRETVPDAVFDRAYEVRVVDLPVDQLLERLHEGKVYVPESAERAREHFFKEGNLIALRELALRRTAERVEAKMRGYKAAHGIEETWHTGERVLVCVSASPHSARLVRAARRMATSLHAELVALYVETPSAIRLSAADRDRLAQHMRLVESLGGEAVTLRADDAAAETVRYARKRNVTKIVVGKPTHPRWRDVLRPPFLDALVRESGEIDVYVISGLEPVKTQPPEAGVERKRRPLLGYGAAVTVVVVSTLLGMLARDQIADVVMIFLLGVVLVAMRLGYGPSLVAAVLSVVAFDVFFIPPYYSFTVYDLRHTVTFAVMFIVALVISNLTQRIRTQADAARDRERRTADLFAVSRELGGATSLESLAAIAASHVRSIFSSKVALLLRSPEGVLSAAVADFDLDEKDREVAGWVFSHGRPAGATTDTLSSSRALFVPLVAARGRAGVLAVLATPESRVSDPNERQLLETIARLVGSALERAELAEEARRAHLRAETEQLRNALLSSVSHDLRTPLAVITGSTSALLGEGAPKDEPARRELLRTAHDESLRLNRLVRNLLDMTRLEAGALVLNEEPQPIEEVVGAALERMEDRLRGRDVQTEIPADLPLAPFDAVLVEQVLINLLENATKHTPPGSPVRVAARAQGDHLEVEIADRGPGVPQGDAERIFDKFYRAGDGKGGGAGLGLTICRGIVQAHGGRIWVEPRDGGGASFRFTLPLRVGVTAA
jgi:two-component system sensor histidine kinase KdpD